MFLRSLTIRGFKSFADKTTIEFAPGISAVVGPNGSGKSNIADAIAWVLGEQGPRALRGGHMSDVIFAGSPGRPALGMAEVRMVIDNRQGLIPVPASEIEISRTLYRSGESEYRLGGRPCRLIDIQELLSDSGIGRALHTLIGQGQLDSVLSARPEERRQLIEEAAGIAKHRRRRERAERKLAGLEQDLLRLQDLLGELRRQLKPLKQQAELAERHESLAREADAVARKLSAARLRELHRERDGRAGAWERGEARRAETQAALEALDRRLTELQAERQAAEASQRTAEDAHAAATQTKSDAESRLRAAIRTEAQARERIATAANRSGRLFALEDELERTEAALGEVRASQEERDPELDAAEERFRAAQAARRDAEEERRRIGEEAAARRAEVEALRRVLEGHQDELARLDASMASLAERRSDGADRVEVLQADIERLDAEATPRTEEMATLEAERAELHRLVAELEARSQGLRARREVVQARLAELVESVGASFMRRQRARGSAPLGLLKDLIDAPPDLVPALHAALGPFADAVVYGRADQAVADALAVPTGGVVLAVAGEAAPSGPEHVAGERRLLGAVRPDPLVETLAARVLAGVYVVGSLAEGVAKHRVHPESVFVTPEGAVVGPAFVRTASGPDGRLDQARREMAAIDHEMAGVQRAVRDHRARLSEVVARAGIVKAEIDELDRSITAAAEEMAERRSEASAVAREEQLIGERVAAVQLAAAGVRDRLSAAVPSGPDELPSVPPIAEPPVHLRVEVEALRRERLRLEAGVDRARSELSALAAEDPIALRRAAEEAGTARAGAEESLSMAEAELVAAVDAARIATTAARRVQDDHTRTGVEWREAAALADRVRAEHDQEDRDRRELTRRIEEAERLLVDTHGAEVASAMAELSGDDTVEDLARQSDLISRRLALLGRVNLLATGELEEVQSRHDFLDRELKDVQAARRDLQEVIREVDRRIAEQFATAFRDVAAQFAALFETMFPGGEGRLTLSDPEDLLDSGIEIEARPGRGRVKRLSLLSGGERSLAALAFLFAIFQARPSPFYLMDEVEAALDDVNLLRFLEVLRTLARDSQLLIVTHQKRTMEAADVLYGVSMRKDGASTVISQRMAEVGAG
jgi:chromosome segregation protein